MLDKTKAYFFERGLTLIDIPKAAIIHEALGLTILLTFWASCYLIRPSHRLLIPLRRKYPNFIASVSQKFEKNFNKYREKLKISSKNRLDNERLLISLGESLVFRNMLRPITIPFKLYATWKIIFILKNTKKLEENEKN